MLPGTVHTIDAQLRERLHPSRGWQPTPLRRAAVLLPIVSGETGAGADHHGDRVLFVLRPAGREPHAGQIALPGGKQEGDESPLETAVRECHEEVGAPPELVTPLGELTPRVSTSRYHVHCVVARVQAFAVVPQPSEVDRVLTVPLRELRSLARWQDLPPPVPTALRQPPNSPHFRHGADLIWGLTGRFLRELAELLEGAEA